MAEHHLTPRRCYRPDEKAQMAEEYRRGDSVASILRRWRVCTVTLYRALRENDTPLRGGNGKPCTLNEAAFDDPTPDACYFAGLLFADGAVHRRRNGRADVVLSLANEDGVMVHAFRDFLGSSHRLVLGRSYSDFATADGYKTVLSVSSVRLADALARYGVLPRKSLTAVVPEWLLHNRDWWRGVVDGDGWVGVNAKGWAFLGLTGTLATCEAFRDFARSITPTSANVWRNNSIWGWSAGCSHAVRLAAVLYSECRHALPRKLAGARAAIA